MIRLALFGSPVTHSLSPRIHRQFGQQAGLELEYTAIESAAGTLAGSLQQFSQSGGSGCNITMPLKSEAMQLATTHSEQVLRAGAANTLILQKNGDWHAESSDGVGLINDLQKNQTLQIAGARVAVVGAGGATASVLACLLQETPKELHLFNRTLSKAQKLAETHADLGPVIARGITELQDSEPFDLLINATSSGHTGEIPALHQNLFTDGACCYDMNYGPASKALGRWCTQHSIRHSDGLGMLVEQAAASFSIWTGHQPNGKAVLDSLRGSVI